MTADTNATDVPETGIACGQTPQAARASIALEAVWEVDAIATMLARDIAEKGLDPTDMWKRALVSRLRDLASISMSALQDTERLEPADGLRAQLEMRPGR